MSNLGNTAVFLYIHSQFQIKSLTLQARHLALHGQPLSGVFAPDGPYLYYNWPEDTGDLWVMDVEKPE